KLIVGVGVSERKTPLLSDELRLSLLQRTAGPISARTGTPVEFIYFDGLMVQACRSAGANIIVRGLRDTTDYNYEMQMVGMNLQMAPDLQTIFVPASPHVRHISASLVRQIAHLGGDISPFVPSAVLKALSEQ
ncbi:MAG TPA: pantetheine-phosphate adenylyltransferase, partial [Devosiaceae bacterium]|nr:pantetheine-phosphate adenylyltransferase [Devosiaceae bacterium]